MKLEDQHTNLELSKKLKELGFKQDSLFSYFELEDEEKFEITTTEICLNCVKNGNDKKANIISSFTSAELGNMLPSKIKFQNKFYFLIIWKREYGTGYAVKYKPNKKPDYFPVKLAGTLANAMAEMLIYLKENNLL